MSIMEIYKDIDRKYKTIVWKVEFVRLYGSILYLRQQQWFHQNS